MIKYFEMDTVDSLGNHATPVWPRTHAKTASASNYGAEIQNFITNMTAESGLYYVVINAMGSFEVWGHNKRGDAFPEEGLTHMSLLSDMGTDNDYGYKTFEYYAKFFRHHVNKSNSPSFGRVVFSHWNPTLHRVELIVGIDRATGKDIIDKIEAGENVAVSMGCRVKYDRCSICGNKAATTGNYCKHLKNHMKEIIDDELAALWSLELKKEILPGTAVFAYNDKPKFFDISYVYAGADAVSFVLGKAASLHGPSSAHLGEASGITDSDLDKLAMFIKSSSIKKSAEINKAIGPNTSMNEDSEALVYRISEVDAIKKLLRENVAKVIGSEKVLSRAVLDPMSRAYPSGAIFSTMLGLGIQPKPEEVQRVMLISQGLQDVADFMSNNDLLGFDPSATVKPAQVNIDTKSNFADPIAKVLASTIADRSAEPDVLILRIHRGDHAKTASGAVSNNDYWFEQSPYSGSLILNSDETPTDISKPMSAIAAIYAGLKLKASGLPISAMVDVYMKRPWLGAVVGGGTYANLVNQVKSSHGYESVNTSMLDLESAADSELHKTASLSSGHAKLAFEAFMVPSIYVQESYKYASSAERGNFKCTKPVHSEWARKLDKMNVRRHG